MNLHADNIRSDLLRALGEGLEVVVRDDRISVLTPVDYPDGDGAVVQVASTATGYVLSDGGEGDARLVATGPGSRAIAPLASAICNRHGAKFDGGRVVLRVSTPDEIAEGCWRVAQASVAIAEAATYHRPPREREHELADLVATSVTSLQLGVERDRDLLGASGHSYKTALYVPEREAVIEPVGGEKPWNVATAVYVEFGDLRDVNGYQLIAVIDDRDQLPGEDVERLLRQVGIVARYSQADQWLHGLANQTLV
jgi:hypothetical protein